MTTIKKYRSPHQWGIQINCPVHKMTKTYALYDEQKESMGIGCAKCFGDLEVYDEDEPERLKANDHIHKVCSACGITANYLTCLKKYGQPPLKPAFEVSTFHENTCDVCGYTRMVTQPRDFFYPDFSLITKKIKL